MEKVRPWCGQPSDRGRLKNRTEHIASLGKNPQMQRSLEVIGRYTVRFPRVSFHVSTSVGSAVLSGVVDTEPLGRPTEQHRVSPCRRRRAK